MDPKGYNEEKLREWLSRPLTQEDDNFDLKEMIPNDDDGKYRLRKEFCGFANNLGGFIFFGVRDRDRSIVGITEDKEFSAKLNQIIARQIYPPTIDYKPYWHIPLKELGKYVYIIKISESTYWQKPHVVYAENRGLCIPFRERGGNLRLITDGAEIRKLFLNSECYYPEYNLHIIGMLKRIKRLPDRNFNMNERVMLHAFKSYLISTGADQNTQIVSELENIETQINEAHRSLFNGLTEGGTVKTDTLNQKIEDDIDNFITKWESKFI